MKKIVYSGSSKILKGLSDGINELLDAIGLKLPYPLASGKPSPGGQGQLLSSNGDGTTSWENPQSCVTSLNGQSGSIELTAEDLDCYTKEELDKTISDLTKRVEALEKALKEKTETT